MKKGEKASARRETPATPPAIKDVQPVPRPRETPAPPAIEDREPARGETPALPAITDEEWESLFRRSVRLHPPPTELQPFDERELTTDVVSAALQAAPPLPGAPLPDGADGADGADAARGPDGAHMPGDAGAEPGRARARRKAGAPARAALTELEWRERFFQRGQLTGLAEGDDLLILTAPDVAGGVTSLRLQGDVLTAVAAAALQQDSGGFDWQDYDDLVLLGMVLEWYLCGVPLDSRPAAVQDAISGIAERNPGLIGRLAALLPPR